MEAQRKPSACVTRPARRSAAALSTRPHATPYATAKIRWPQCSPGVRGCDFIPYQPLAAFHFRNKSATATTDIVFINKYLGTGIGYQNVENLGCPKKYRWFNHKSPWNVNFPEIGCDCRSELVLEFSRYHGGKNVRKPLLFHRKICANGIRGRRGRSEGPPGAGAPGPRGSLGGRPSSAGRLSGGRFGGHTRGPGNGAPGG